MTIKNTARNNFELLEIPPQQQPDNNKPKDSNVLADWDTLTLEECREMGQKGMACSALDVPPDATFSLTGLKNFLQCLHYNSTVDTINFQTKFYGTTGIQYFIDLLTKNSCIKTLTIAPPKNSLGVEELQLLAKSLLSAQTSLNKVTLAIDVDTTALQQFLMVVQHNFSFCAQLALNLTHNQTTEKQQLIIEINYAIWTNQLLQTKVYDENFQEKLIERILALEPSLVTPKLKEKIDHLLSQFDLTDIFSDTVKTDNLLNQLKKIGFQDSECFSFINSTSFFKKLMSTNKQLGEKPYKDLELCRSLYFTLTAYQVALSSCYSGRIWQTLIAENILTTVERIEKSAVNSWLTFWDKTTPQTIEVIKNYCNRILHPEKLHPRLEQIPEEPTLTCPSLCTFL